MSLQVYKMRTLVSGKGFLKEKPVWKYNMALKNTAYPKNLEDVPAECQFKLGNKFCQAKTEYRTKKPHWSPSS
jgi:hypothetical protein